MQVSKLQCSDPSHLNLNALTPVYNYRRQPQPNVFLFHDLSYVFVFLTSAEAAAVRRSFFSAADSGRYLDNKRNKLEAAHRDDDV